jgi:hypothetical protein
MKYRTVTLQHLADGLTITEVATELGVGYDYLKAQLLKWREDSGADTTYQLIAMAIRRKEID